MSLFSGLGFKIAYFVTDVVIWLVGLVRFVLWVLFRWWYVPRDEFAQTLELDSSILAFLSADARAWYTRKQGDRRQRSHHRRRELRA